LVDPRQLDQLKSWLVDAGYAPTDLFVGTVSYAGTAGLLGRPSTIREMWASGASPGGARPSEAGLNGTRRHAAVPERFIMWQEEASNMRTLIAGLAGGVAMNLAMLLTFRTIGFGWDGQGILLTHPAQSEKLIAVWTTIEPLPLVAVDPLPIVLGLILFAIGHAFVYKWLSAGWPTGVAARALRLAGLIFFMTFLFWEFFTPFNQFGEPLPLIAIELVFWAIIACAEAFAIAFVMERRS
jgi:hypothetical protein